MTIPVTIHEIMNMAQLKDIRIAESLETPDIESILMRTPKRFDLPIELPTLVSNDETWIEALLSTLDASIELSPTTLLFYRTVSDGLFQVMVNKKKDTWKNEEDYRKLFGPLQELALHCALDIVQHESPNTFQSSVYVDTESNTGLLESKGNITGRIYFCPTSGLYLTTTELKTLTDVPDVSMNLTKLNAQPGGPWSRHGAMTRRRTGSADVIDTPTRGWDAYLDESDAVPALEKVVIDTILQTYGQLFVNTIYEESSQEVITPLYGIFGNFNQMTILKRPTHINQETVSITLAGPYEPKQLLPRMISFDLDFHSNGRPLNSNSNPKSRTLHAWTNGLSGEQNQHLPDTASEGVPHVTIVGVLGKGVSGTAYMAISSDGFDLVWKEIFLDEESRHYAATELEMYDGPLAQLQGTVVPVFYGAFYHKEQDSVALLMEYVGSSLGDCQEWDNISPDIKKQALHHYRRLRKAGVDHGDFQPNNVCLTDYGEVRIIDFSHSTRIPNGEET
ncbi:hypothetical protein H0H93_011180 [Arthromyces matolae]|nr:hypothetical protein H0H93_011180 [Arthromyces matolae]